MKELEELKEIVREVIRKREPSLKDYESEDFEDLSEEEKENLYEQDLYFFSKFKNYNFLGYDAIEKRSNLFETYEEAKKYVDRGGQILVINQDKIYTYKIKSDDEYFEYLSSEIKKENLQKKDFYGL